MKSFFFVHKLWPKLVFVNRQWHSQRRGYDNSSSDFRHRELKIVHFFIVKAVYLDAISMNK